MPRSPPLADPADPGGSGADRAHRRGGPQRGVEVSLCGDMASTPAHVTPLLDTGLRVLSCAPAQIGAVKLAVSRYAAVRRRWLTAAQPTDPIAEYKALLRRYIDRRPSGTRQRLAEAFGTHKSFISQITNPAYRVPLPAQHIPALFKVCHFSARRSSALFMDIYARAHPGQFGAIEELASFEEGVLRIPLPHFADPERRHEVEQLIRDFAERVIALLQDAGEK